MLFKVKATCIAKRQNAEAYAIGYHASKAEAEARAKCGLVRFLDRHGDEPANGMQFVDMTHADTA